MEADLLHHYTNLTNLGGIAEDGVILPGREGEELWKIGPVVFLTKGGPDWAGVKKPLLKVRLDFDPIWIDGVEPFLPLISPALRWKVEESLKSRGLYGGDMNDWYVTRKPIPAKRIKQIIYDGQRFRSARWNRESESLQLEAWHRNVSV